MSFALDPTLRCLHKRRKYRQYQYLEWRTNGALQLHRLAQDELGYGKWSGCTDSVPITRPQDMLADLDITELEYPRLNREVPVGEEVKPESNSSAAEVGGSEQGSAEASEDNTLHNSDVESAPSKPQHTLEAEDSISPIIDEHQQLDAQRVSMLSEEDEGRARTDSHGIVAEHAQERNKKAVLSSRV